jgi:hypothetical protein
MAKFQQYIIEKKAEKAEEKKKAPGFRKLEKRDCCDECKSCGETGGRCMKYDFYPGSIGNTICDDFAKPTSIYDKSDRG